MLIFLLGRRVDLAHFLQRAAHRREITSLISSKAAGNNPHITIRMEDRAVLLYRLESDTNLVPIFSV